MATAPLRAFAFIVGAGRIELSIHRDVSTILSTWGEASSADPASAMMLHVGFERPETDSVATLLESWSGRVLVSESTRWSLPVSFETSSEPVACVTIAGRREPLPVYLGSAGWGYTLSGEPQEERVLAQTDPEPWLLALAAEFGTHRESLQRLGIATDQQYLEKRKELPVAIRDEIDDFRFAKLLSSVDQSDPFALLRIAPEWLLHFPISCFDDLPLRVRNALRRERMEVVGEIGRLTPEYVLAIENFGKRSYETLAPAILAIAIRKPYQQLAYSRNTDFAARQVQEGTALVSDRLPSEPIPQEQVQYRTLWFGVQMTLSQMAPRDRLVLEERLGRHQPPKTLDALGAILGVTRERARQIEGRGLEALREKSWATELTRRLGQRFAGRREPLFLDLLAAEDDWFQGFEESIPFLGQIVERLHEGIYWAWPLNGRLILARLREVDWDALERSTRSALATQTGVGLTQPDIRLFIEAAATAAECRELVDALTAAIWEDLQFARDPDLGTEVFVGIGRSIRAVVAAIMSEANEAMDLRTISCRCAERIGEKPSDMAIRGALNTIGAYPFSGRRYALERHIGLSQAEIEEILAALEQILAAGPAGKQWHCTELLSALGDERSDFPVHVDQYVVNIVLHRSSQARYLGRFVWVSRASDASSAKDRLDVADLTVLVLQRAGRPLSTAELRTEISDVRGLNAIFQVFPSDKVARLDAGLWGLVDRDFGLSAAERREIFDQLEQTLSVRNKALHVSEIRDALAGQHLVVPDQVTNEMILGLCQTDGRFRVAPGQLLGLARWTSMNRLSVRGAIRQAVREQGNEISPTALYHRVDELVERRVERFVMHTELKVLGFVYDERADRWIPEDNDAEDLLETPPDHLDLV